MGHITELIMGKIKDRVSQSKAAIKITNPKTLPLHLSLLRATTHDHLITPLNQKHITKLLSYGNSSRATAAPVIEALMTRLHTTRCATVAVKTLIVVHHIIKRGSFILQDQLSIYPATGGRNYLKLTNFRDNSNWELSNWVRWYALYLEHLLFTSRILGFFLSSSSSISSSSSEKLSAILNIDLIKETDSLIGFLEEMSKKPDSCNNKLVENLMEFVTEDYLSAIDEVSIRVTEFKERLSGLSYGDSVELICALKRLEDCKERLFVMSNKKKVLIECFWVSISELKDKVGDEKVYREERMIVTIGRRRKGSNNDKASESARFSERVLNSVRFSSGRYGFHKPNFANFGVVDSVQSCA